MSEDKSIRPGNDIEVKDLKSLRLFMFKELELLNDGTRTPAEARAIGKTVTNIIESYKVYSYAASAMERLGVLDKDEKRSLLHRL